jgi:eight-cysteine-cluster-containing protein
MRLALAALLSIPLLASCTRQAPRPVPANGGPGTTEAPATAAGARTPVFSPGDARHAVFEGPSFQNACASDGECKVGGCSGEVCTAEEGVNTACMVHPDQPRDATCGCVQGDCVWFRAAQAGGGEGGGVGAAQGDPCDDGRCAAGLSCLSYLGIAGGRGPTFTSCEIPCNLPTSTCPEGQHCVTIADGPGAVCRPR